MKVMRKTYNLARAIELCSELRGIDYKLMDLVTKYQGDTSLAVTGHFVQMQRNLRSLRCQIEAEIGL